MAIRARWRIGAAVVLGSLASIGEAAAAEDTFGGAPSRCGGVSRGGAGRRGGRCPDRGDQPRRGPGTARLVREAVRDKLPKVIDSIMPLIREELARTVRRLPH